MQYYLVTLGFFYLRESDKEFKESVEDLPHMNTASM